MLRGTLPAPVARDSSSGEVSGRGRRRSNAAA